jgi:tetratricopeptide (TPR) repeat protein
MRIFLQQKRAGVMAFSLLSFVSSIPLCAQTGATPERGAFEITSGLGRPLYALPDDAAVTAARKAFAGDPRNPDLALKLSKAEAARRQYKEAVATCTQALTAAPNNADLYLERGHRELGLREFKPAMTDLQRAAEIDPSKLDSFYHLALSHYFQGEFAEAGEDFKKARDLAKSDDSLIDCTNWLYVSLRRAGKENAAAEALARITPAVKNTEPHLYFYLSLLHFYQGKLTAEQVLPPKPANSADTESELSFDTVSYGVGNWRVYHHDMAGALPLFRNVVTGEAWNAWGFIGSEVELVRSK